MSLLSHRIAAVAESLLDGVPGKALAARAERISAAYRANEPSRGTIRDATDALVYALMRMPATAAAVEAVSEALAERAPDFAPQTILDAGAGPGTASLVLGETWPEAELALSDAHPDFLVLAKRLLATERPEAQPRLTQVDLADAQARLPEADLVVASYALTEFDDGAYDRVAQRLWVATSGVLMLIEPGRPRDYERLMAFRLRAIGLGARIVAPCAHAGDCPLEGDDWCHFSVRLPRSRSHLRLKSGALGYEDEKFSYLVLARDSVALTPALPRVLAPPQVAKHETRFKLCAPDGTAGWTPVSRRDPHFSRIRRAGWGDCVVVGDVDGQQ